MRRRADRSSRRQETVEAYMALIARGGAHTASSRALAVEMGVSTGALWHWFADMDEVVDETFRWVVRTTNTRILAASRGRRGLEALVAMLAEILPVSEQTINESFAVVSFWGRVPSNPALALFQSEVEASWRADLVAHLEEAITDGDVHPAASAPDIADVLLVLSKGQQLERVLGTDLAAPRPQWAVVGTVMDPWIVDVTQHDLPW